MKRSRGFSLVEVVIGVAIMALAFVGISQLSMQMIRVEDYAVRYQRVATTIANVAADTKALLRYDGPAAQALKSGLVPATFTLYQWEPDLARAPLQCSAEHISDSENVLRISCRDRQGVLAKNTIDLGDSQPYPASVVTASPSGSS